MERWSVWAPMRHALFSIPFLFFVAAGCATHSPRTSHPATEPSPEEVLPLVRVRLYASGVGYFEREGDLKAGQHSLPIPSGHLDDALKSLVVLGPDSEAISISFPSRLSPAVARARAGLPASEDSALSYDRLLAALRGEEVEVRLKGRSKSDGTSVRGRVVEVVAIEPSHPSYDHGPAHRTLPEGHSEPEEHPRLHLVVLSENQEILQFEVNELSSVRPLNPAISQRFEAALAARVASRTGPTQALELMAGQKLPEKITLAYLAETPTWRTSYRLMVGGAEAKNGPQATLQAWALIHNDTDEAWEHIQLELAEGRPSSFLFPLAAPRYHRRDLETPLDELSSVPQLSTRTPDAMWGDFSDYQGETIPVISGLGHEGGTGSATGYGSGHGRLGGSHKTRPPTIRTGSVSHGTNSPLLWLGNLATRTGVRSSGKDAVSVFKIGQELTLPPQHSATLPFLKARISARPIVWFNDATSPAEQAVGVSNNTANTFPAGPMAVYSEGGLLGETMLEVLRPGARQFAYLSDEPDMNLKQVASTTKLTRRHVDFDGKLGVHSIRSTTRSFSFSNRTGREAEVYVGLNIVTNAKLQGSDRLDYDSTRRRPFAVFTVPTGGGAAREISSQEGIVVSHSLSDLTLDLVDVLASDTALPERERAVLESARIPILERERLFVEEEELETEQEAVQGDLDRLEKQLNALSSQKTGEAHTTLMNRILAQHDRVSGLKAKERQLHKRQEAATADLRKTLNQLQQFREEILKKRSQARLEAKNKDTR